MDPWAADRYAAARAWGDPCQYVPFGFGEACQQAEISRAMGSVGDCWDNAVAETSVATLKKELVRRRSRPTRRGLTGPRATRRRDSALCLPAPVSCSRDRV
jgi:transposase InsO family protein